MKACMVLQRRFAYLGHDLAVLLRERGITKFCAYVILRESHRFLSSQKEIEYTGLLLDEEVQKGYKTEKVDPALLARIEREYGNVWSFISVDRVIRLGQHVREYPHDATSYSYEEMLCMVQVYVKAIEAFLEREKPDFVFIYQPGAMGMLLFYTIAKKRGIPVRVVVFPVTENLISLSEEYDRLTWVDMAFEDYRTMHARDVPAYGRAKKFVEEFRSKPIVYSKVYNSLVKHGKSKQFRFLIPKNTLVSLRYIYQMWRNWLTDADLRTDYTSVHPFWYLVDRIRRKVRNLIGAGDLYDTYDTGKPFAFYALHYEPELSVLLLSSFDTDQIAIVRRLARALPAGMYLYVKEHPQMTPYRPRWYYRELKKIPNVRLLRPELSGFEIMKHASLVATISGAAGWEAALLGKPVITFGDVFYDSLPYVARSRMPEELPVLVASQLDGKLDDEALYRYVAALFEHSAQSDLLQLWTFENDPYERRRRLASFADLIVRTVRPGS